MIAHPRLVLLLGVVVGVSVPVRAETDIPVGYRHVAAVHDIPSALFYALALAESGRWMADLGASRPWPWALNIEGSGHYYPSRQAAELALSGALDSGQSSVDVGLMQISWRYHRAALGTPRDALDPYRNLNAAAVILVACRDEREDWWAAVACYHAPNAPDRGARYRERVRTIWTKLQPHAEPADEAP